MLRCRGCCGPVGLYRSVAEQIFVQSPPAGIAGVVVVVVGVSPSAEGWKPLTLNLGGKSWLCLPALHIEAYPKTS